MTSGPSMTDLARRPVLARLLVIGACAVLAVAQHATPRSLIPAVVLVGIAVVSSIQLPASVPRWLAPSAEGLASAALVGALGADGRAYTAYTLVPVTVAGLTCRPRKAAIAVTSTAVAYVAAAMTVAPPAMVTSTALDAAAWTISLYSFWFLAASARRAWLGPVRQPDPHYLDAHRLLSELQPVSRQLSLGLDPRTLAEALREELCALAGADDGCVLIRTEGGRFIALTGAEPDGIDDRRILAAWSGRGDMSIEPDGTTRVWLPVRMGEDRVALAVLTMGGPAPDTSVGRAHGKGAMPALRRLREVADEAGPRLASALLFDEVRRLATVDERNRVAREIHDGIAQDLASLAYLVDDARLDVDPQTSARLAEVSDAVRRLVNELRLRLFDLRAGVDDTVSLGGAVTEYLQHVGPQAGIAVRLTLDEGPRRLPTSVEVEILRILQEAVTNVRRHAGAQRLTVELSVHPPQARLLVQDDGRGLQQGRPDSMGLTGMRERAARIGADLSIGNAPGGGTRVRLVIDAASARISHPQVLQLDAVNADETSERITSGVARPPAATRAPVDVREEERTA